MEPSNKRELYARPSARLCSLHLRFLHCELYIQPHQLQCKRPHSDTIQRIVQLLAPCLWTPSVYQLFVLRARHHQWRRGSGFSNSVSWDRSSEYVLKLIFFLLQYGRIFKMHDTFAALSAVTSSIPPNCRPPF